MVTSHTCHAGACGPVLRSGGYIAKPVMPEPVGPFPAWWLHRMPVTPEPAEQFSSLVVTSHACHAGACGPVPRSWLKKYMFSNCKGSCQVIKIQKFEKNCDWPDPNQPTPYLIFFKRVQQKKTKKTQNYKKSFSRIF